MFWGLRNPPLSLKSVNLNPEKTVCTLPWSSEARTFERGDPSPPLATTQDIRAGRQVLGYGGESLKSSCGFMFFMKEGAGSAAQVWMAEDTGAFWECLLHSASRYRARAGPR